MISNSDELTRRILNFPAIRPCESINFSTIITPLINLGHEICAFRSRTFFTNRKNARASIRLIETLVVFLEEIRIVKAGSATAIVLSLSELHFIFLKLHFLLEDCARDDARLFMAMRSEKVSICFREAMRAVAVALDVLVVMELDVSIEVKELGEFVRRQALKLRFEVEVFDEMLVRSVRRILDRFEDGIAPDFGDLESVVGCLGIRSWNDCNREIKFLENEIGQECLTTGKRDFEFLSSLMVFLIYCRCTLFVSYSNNSTLQQSGEACTSELIKCLKVDDFRCPITLEMMIDPVTISTGHTYGRDSILKWFKSGNHTCPKTGERLICVDLVPNHALKRIIKQYCQGNRIPFPESNGPDRAIARSSHGSVAADQAVKMLAKFLVGKMSGTNEEQQKSTYEIRLLTKTSVFNRSCLVESNAIPCLLNLLCSTNPESQENAMAGLLNLSKHSRSRNIMVENGGLDLVVNVLNHGLKPEARQHAAGALFYLASVEEYRKTIGRTLGSLPGLMGLIWDGPARGKKNSLATILALLVYPENHWRVLSAGLVPLLVNLLTSSENENLVIDSLAVLVALAEKLDGAMAIVSAGTLPIVVEILSSSNSKTAKVYCVSVLLALCVNDGADVVPLLVKNQSLMVALYSLITEGPSRSSKNSTSLIRILHAFDGKGSARVMSSEDRFVHVW